MKITVGNNNIGEDEEVYIIAECGMQAEGDIDRGMTLIEAAKESGADAIKFQFFDPDNNPGLKDKNTIYTYETSEGPRKMPLYQILKNNHLTIEDLADLKVYAEDAVGITMFCTVDYIEGIEPLEKIGMPAYKICSNAANNPELVSRVVATGKPMFIDIRPQGDCHESLLRIPTGNGKEVAVIYSPKWGSIDLNILRILCKRPYVVGYSPPRADIGLDITAVEIGAKVIEEKLTLDKDRLMVEHFYSLEPNEFEKLVNEIRSIR